MCAEYQMLAIGFTGTLAYLDPSTPRPIQTTLAARSISSGSELILDLYTELPRVVLVPLQLSGQRCQQFQ